MRKINIVFYIICLSIVFYILYDFVQNSKKQYLAVYDTTRGVENFKAEAITTDNKSYSFVSNIDATVQGIEVYLATYNRLNINEIVFELYDETNKAQIFSKRFKTLFVFDNSYHTIGFPKISIKKDNKYRISFMSLKNKPDNFIAIWKDANNRFVTRFFVYGNFMTPIKEYNMLFFKKISDNKADLVSIAFIFVITILILAISLLSLNIGGNNDK